MRVGRVLGRSLRGLPPARALCAAVTAVLAAAASSTCFVGAATGPDDLPLNFERLSLEQGLSQSIVEAIAQDTRGFLWFGTEDGLNRYDGYEFRVFRPDPLRPGGISTPHVTALLPARDGRLWIGTFNGGLNRYDPRTGEFRAWRHRPGDEASLPDDLVHALVEEPDGILWVGTGAGLARVDPVRETVTRILPAPVTALRRDRDGFLWAGTEGHGLVRYDPRSGGRAGYRHDPGRPASLAADDVTALLEDAAGRLWVGTRRAGLDLLDRATGRFLHFREAPGRASSLAGDHVTALAEAGDGRLWVGTNGGGLHLLDPRSGAFVPYRSTPAEPRSLSRDEVRAIFEDAGGMLWVGTYGGGLNRADPARRRFRTWRAQPANPDGVGNEIVWSFLEAADGAVWVGSHGGGLERLDQVTGRWTRHRARRGDAAALGDDRVRVICPSRDGTYWIGTDGGGLSRFDPRTFRFTTWRHDPRRGDSLGHDQIRALVEDRQGLLWIGTYGGGLDRFDPATGAFTHYRHDESDPATLGNDVVRALLEDRAGRLWVATHGGGLNLLDRERGTFRRFLAAPGRPEAHALSSNFIFALLEDRRGRHWVGTWGGGLNLFDPEAGTAKVFTTADGLPSDNIYGILQDDDGRLWMSTNKGLARFDPERGRFHTYSAADGLQSDEFNGNAFHRGASGRMYFGGIKGFTTFLPSEIRDNPNVPPVAITRFLKLNRDAEGSAGIAEAAGVEVRPEDTTVSFEFAALDFAAPARNRYAYRLKGFDPDWIPADAGRRFATYTRLPPGSYAFEVRAANNDGAWNERGASLAVVVLPPYYRTWWFRLLVAALLGAAAFVSGSAWAARQRERGRLRLLERELDVAARIQSSLLPNVFPPFPERGDVDVYARMVPARHVGGDFYDFYFVGPGRLAFALGDVSGKGVPAALQLSLCRVLIKGAAMAGRPVQDVAAVVNGTLVGELPENGFITAFLGVLDLATGRLDYVLAGQNPPAVLRAGGGVEFLDQPANPFLGKFPGLAFAAGAALVGPHDTLVLYTDGLTEANDAAGRFFDEDPRRLRDLLAGAAGEGLAEAAERVLGAVESFAAGAPPSDDRTLMLIRRLPAAVPAAVPR